MKFRTLIDAVEAAPSERKFVTSSDQRKTNRRWSLLASSGSKPEVKPKPSFASGVSGQEIGLSSSCLKASRR